MNEFLPTTPFDLYELHLLKLVASSGSFTAAAREAGLTQSAVTRQVQGVETRLGLSLFERTTRKLNVTKAGAFLLGEATRLIGDLDAILRRLREEFSGTRKEIRIGVSKSISVAYLPGLFAAQRRRQPEVRLRVTHQPGNTLLSRLEENSVDVAIVSTRGRVPSGLRVAHRFTDAFDLIAPADCEVPTAPLRPRSKPWRDWISGQPWLLLNSDSASGASLRTWMQRQGWVAVDATEADSFDLIINLVALGQGISLVPQRSLAIYGRNRRLQRFTVPDRFARELVVLARRHPAPEAHVLEFVENILF